ncbi:hypothetical protein [Halovivax gelatinilyticus]|uniref:hypothetical protein n=1 Tax=Halovivax gelatinilyticus TaxID=2961597 RepID=UPI0020CA5A74|nr:hypothetical protein [Halovivax gelatinilyticus]
MEAEQRSGEEPTYEPAISREISHDEFDPIGTLTLIAIYFLILLFMWFFVYFVEFLGNDPTVIGSVGPVILA